MDGDIKIERIQDSHEESGSRHFFAIFFFMDFECATPACKFFGVFNASWIAAHKIKGFTQINLKIINIMKVKLFLICVSLQDSSVSTGN